MTAGRAAVVAVAAVALAASAFYILLPRFIQALVRAVLSIRYRFRVTGLENLPRTGPVLIVANHQTWIDGFLLAAVVPRRGRALVNAGMVNLPVFKQLVVRSGIIPVPYTGPRAIRAAIDACRAALERGECVGLFPEGQISRTGLLNPFFRGIEVILRGKGDVPVVPVALDNLWGSVFSRSGGKFFARRPEGRRRTVRIAFGPPVPPPVTAVAARQALMTTLVRARSLADGPTRLPETFDPSLPRWEHPTLGLLTASAPDVHAGEVHQVGTKPGTVGHPVPGVALRAVDEAGREQPPGTEGRLEALIPLAPDWADTGRRGSLDADGFVRLTGEGAVHGSAGP